MTDALLFGLYRPEVPLPPEPRYAQAGIAFNGQQSVRDIAAARAFYCDRLGWTAWFDDLLRLDCNNLGMPQSHVGRTPMNVIIASAGRDPQGAWRNGQVELVEWVEFRGLDLAARAVPLVAGGLPLFAGPVDVELAPYGRVRLFAVRSPDGAIVEFLQPS